MKPMQPHSKQRPVHNLSILFSFPLSLLLLLLLCSGAAIGQKAAYYDEIRKAVEKGSRDLPAVISAWKSASQTNVLWGYNAPAQPIYLASTLGFLYEHTKDRAYAEKAARLLSEFGDLRQVLPKDYDKSRVEYSDGVPPLSNFFFLPPYIRAYVKIRDSGVMDEAAKRKIEKEIAESADFVFRFPEWGAHNRAMLRAEGLNYAWLAMPRHPHALRWKQMAEAIADDNIAAWEIEDATVYHPVWLHSLLAYATASGKAEVFSSPFMRYYMEYYTHLMAPSGFLPDFGDAYWNSSMEGLRFIAIFEKGASTFQNPEMKWAAQSMFATARAKGDTLSVGAAYHLCDAYEWAEERIVAAAPTSLSQEVLDDVIGKKILFRNGTTPQSTYFLLNYRDEGDGGKTYRDYLRRTISVEEEKMHHGHADENSIVMLMHGGSVLLHDGGYRNGLPSGEFGAWRQDYFHNRLVVRKNKRDPHQGVLEFVRNSGAYRSVRTQKIDFLKLSDVDYSRTRVIDEDLGYQSDRAVVYVRTPGFFLVFDMVKALKPDYFTYSTFWHGQSVKALGEHRYEMMVDSLPEFPPMRQHSLVLQFLETYAKTEGEEPISRSPIPEKAIYQTQSSQYKIGDYELFVTALFPKRRDEGIASLPRVTMLPTSAPYRSVAVQIEHDGSTSVIGLKCDLEMEIARENIRPRYLYDLGKVSYGDIETDAHFLYARTGKDSLRYSAVNVLKVIYQGKELMAALPNTHALQLDGGVDRIGYSKWRKWEETVGVRAKKEGKNGKKE
jgi:hypothetical protein